MTNTLSEFHSGLSQWPPNFYRETSKETAFFIIKRLEVFNGSNHSNFILLSPLASHFKVFKPTQITRSNFLDTITPFDKTEDKNTTQISPNHCFKNPYKELHPSFV